MTNYKTYHIINLSKTNRAAIFMKRWLRFGNSYSWADVVLATSIFRVPLVRQVRRSSIGRNWSALTQPTQITCVWFSIDSMKKNDHIRRWQSLKGNALKVECSTHNWRIACLAWRYNLMNISHTVISVNTEATVTYMSFHIRTSRIRFYFIFCFSYLNWNREMA